jgi:hypothetical protein
VFSFPDLLIALFPLGVALHCAALRCVALHAPHRADIPTSSMESVYFIQNMAIGYWLLAIGYWQQCSSAAVQQCSNAAVL